MIRVAYIFQNMFWIQCLAVVSIIFVMWNFHIQENTHGVVSLTWLYLGPYSAYSSSTNSNVDTLHFVCWITNYIVRLCPSLQLGYKLNIGLQGYQKSTGTSQYFRNGWEKLNTLYLRNVLRIIWNNFFFLVSEKIMQWWVYKPFTTSLAAKYWGVPELFRLGTGSCTSELLNNLIFKLN